MDRDTQLDHLRTTAKLLGTSMEELAALAASAATDDPEPPPVAPPPEDAPPPTVAEFHAQVIELESLKAGWVKRKGLHQRFVDEFGERRLTEVTAAHVELFAHKARRATAARHAARRAARSNDPSYTTARTTDGTGTQRSVIEAARAFFNVAIKHGLMHDNPARLVDLPERKPVQPRAANQAELEELWAAVISGGDDPELDSLLVWFHLETGARRGGALGLTRVDLLWSSRSVRLYEKGGKKYDQPVSTRLLRALDAHSRARGSTTLGGPVFVYRFPGEGGVVRPVTKKRYETLTKRIRLEVPWALERGWKPHDLRRTAITSIERLTGSPAVARLFARHAAASTTDGYTLATPEEVRAAVDIWVGEGGDDLGPDAG